MKVLITGTAGFIGFHLTERLLQDGYTVIGVDQVNDYYDVNLKKDRLAFSGIDWNDEPQTGIRSSKYEHYVFYKASLEDKSAIYSIFEKSNPMRYATCCAGGSSLFSKTQILTFKAILSAFKIS